MQEKNKNILNVLIVIVILYLFFLVVFVFFQQNRNKVAPVSLVTQGKLLTVDEYHRKQTDKIVLFESTLDSSKSIEGYLNDEKVVELFRYANALTRQHDFVNSYRASSTIEAITIYRKIINSNLSDKFKAQALNDIYTAFVQSGSDLIVLKNVFSAKEIKAKKVSFNLNIKTNQKLTQKDKLFLFQNLLADKEIKSISLFPTKIALARVAMQDYINQLFFRAALGGNVLNDNSNKDVIRIKKDFSEKVIKDYEKYKLAEANVLKPDTFSNVESKYLMAWSLNRAGVYTGSSSIIDESYKLFNDGVLMTENLKKTSNDFFGLSVITKIFYASAILGSNKDAYVDASVVENRKKSLLILSELASPEFITNPNYTGSRSYLSVMKDSNFDWITTLILLSKYDEGLKSNLKSLGWKV